MSSSERNQGGAPSPEQSLAEQAAFVAAYLEQHPEFLRQHPEILEKLYLPHRSGAAVSLVEKQQAVLRERNTELRTRLNGLMETSKANDALFNKSRALVLNLIRADSPGEIFKALQKSFKEDFRIEYYSLVLLDRDIEGAAVRHLSSEELHQQLPGLVSSGEAICGVLRPQHVQLLFGAGGKGIGSAVAMRLATEQVYGVLAIGSANAHRYHSGMDTLFLRFIADVLSLLLYPKI